MSTLAFLLFAVQACLIQNAFSQCLRGFGPAMAGPVGWDGLAGPAMLGYGGLAPIAAYSEYAAYGGSGVGNVAVAGEMGVAGTTLVAGQVPILGAVDFGGVVPAAGAVSIAGNCACGCNAAAVPASNGGGLGVSSASTIPPSGVSVLSENAIEGSLAVAGSLPFLGTVALEGALPTAGAGAVNYGCGNGAVAILAEDIAPAGIAGPLGYGFGAWGAEGYGYGPYGYGTGSLNGPFRAGCGCGRLI
ncbi:unnamed protein product [Euphydryas editha]|uniref:Uncharacterized protein n=1 Tax=Euphydryas editha TaxID=104508 RepID=A0AAU9TD04_EUPED|nr:unnamed protein product [Euphydryas editha]